MLAAQAVSGTRAIRERYCRVRRLELSYQVDGLYGIKTEELRRLDDGKDERKGRSKVGTTNETV